MKNTKAFDCLAGYSFTSGFCKIYKELENVGWLNVKKKPNYTGISLNTKCKKEIIEFIEKEIPEFRGWII